MARPRQRRATPARPASSSSSGRTSSSSAGASKVTPTHRVRTQFRPAPHRLLESDEIPYYPEQLILYIKKWARDFRNPTVLTAVIVENKLALWAIVRSTDDVIRRLAKYEVDTVRDLRMVIRKFRGLLHDDAQVFPAQIPVFPSPKENEESDSTTSNPTARSPSASPVPSWDYRPEEQPAENQAGPSNSGGAHAEATGRPEMPAAGPPGASASAATAPEDLAGDEGANADTAATIDGIAPTACNDPSHPAVQESHHDVGVQHPSHFDVGVQHPLILVDRAIDTRPVADASRVPAMDPLRIAEIAAAEGMQGGASRAGALRITTQSLSLPSGGSAAALRTPSATRASRPQPQDQASDSGTGGYMRDVVDPGQALPAVPSSSIPSTSQPPPRTLTQDRAAVEINAAGRPPPDIVVTPATDSPASTESMLDDGASVDEMDTPATTVAPGQSPADTIHQRQPVNRDPHSVQGTSAPERLTRPLGVEGSSQSDAQNPPVPPVGLAEDRDQGTPSSEEAVPDGLAARSTMGSGGGTNSEGHPFSSSAASRPPSVQQPVPRIAGPSRSPAVTTPSPISEQCTLVAENQADGSSSTSSAKIDSQSVGDQRLNSTGTTGQSDVAPSTSSATAPFQPLQQASPEQRDSPGLSQLNDSSTLKTTPVLLLRPKQTTPEKLPMSPSAQNGGSSTSLTANPDQQSLQQAVDAQVVEGGGTSAASATEATSTVQDCSNAALPPEASPATEPTQGSEIPTSTPQDAQAPAGQVDSADHADERADEGEDLDDGEYDEDESYSHITESNASLSDDDGVHGQGSPDTQRDESPTAFAHAEVAHSQVAPAEPEHAQYPSAAQHTAVEQKATSELSYAEPTGVDSPVVPEALLAFLAAFIVASFSVQDASNAGSGISRDSVEAVAEDVKFNEEVGPSEKKKGKARAIEVSPPLAEDQDDASDRSLSPAAIPHVSQDTLHQASAVDHSVLHELPPLSEEIFAPFLFLFHPEASYEITAPAPSSSAVRIEDSNHSLPVDMYAWLPLGETSHSGVPAINYDDADLDSDTQVAITYRTPPAVAAHVEEMEDDTRTIPIESIYADSDVEHDDGEESTYVPILIQDIPRGTDEIPTHISGDPSREASTAGSEGSRLSYATAENADGDCEDWPFESDYDFPINSPVMVHSDDSSPARGSGSAGALDGYCHVEAGPDEAGQASVHPPLTSHSPFVTIPSHHGILSTFSSPVVVDRHDLSPLETTAHLPFLPHDSFLDRTPELVANSVTSPSSPQRVPLSEITPVDDRRPWFSPLIRGYGQGSPAFDRRRSYSLGADDDRRGAGPSRSPRIRRPFTRAYEPMGAGWGLLQFHEK